MPYRESAHVVHFHQTFDPDSVCDYVQGGLAGGQSAIVIAVPSHSEAIKARLALSDPQKAAARVAYLDAQDLVIGLTGSTARVEKAWQKRIGALVKAAAALSPRGQVFVYTEAPDLLWKRGQRATALQVERLWTGIRMRCSASIVCGYAVDPLECAQSAFDVVELHDRARAGEEPGRLKRFEKAVDQTLREQAAMVRSLVGQDLRLRDLPFGHAAMIWLCRHMPKMAEKVAAAARD